MSYNYTQYETYLATLMATTTSDTFFITILPMCIDYAEQRIYRELQLLNTRVSATAIATPNANELTLPSGQIVVNRINVITPVSATPDTGTRNPYYPVAPEWMDFVYPTESNSGIANPGAFAMTTQTSVILGPAPDQAYTVEIIGTIRPSPLSSSNTTTILTDGLPDLFMAASMIFMAGYQKNFGAQADDPQMAQSWETQYEKLLASATTEEFMKKFQATSWTSAPKSPAVDNQRG